MLTAELVTEIDKACREVAASGWGLVAVVIEAGRPTRLQQQVDRKIEKLSSASN